MTIRHSTDSSQENHPQSTVAIAYLSGLLQYIKDQGIPVADLLAGTSLVEADFAEKHRRVDGQTYFHLFEQAVALTADPLLGLKVGSRVKPGNYGVIGYVVMACRTFGEVLLRSGRYQKLVGDIGYSEIVFVGEEAEVRWIANYDAVPPSVVEEHMASIVTYARWLAGQDKKPSQIGFQHAAQGHRDVYEAVFQCDVVFEQDHTVVRFPLAFTDIVLPQFDMDLCNLLDRKAQTELEALEAESEFVGAIKKIIRNGLPDGVPTLESVSVALAKSEKTLQRELGHFDTNFKALLDNTRRELALGYISNQAIELNELAFLLGFSEQSAFQRAFKRWTGTTPGKFRRSLV